MQNFFEIESISISYRISYAIETCIQVLICDFFFLITNVFVEIKLYNICKC